MFLLKVDCSKYDSEEKLCQAFYDEFFKIDMALWPNHNPQEEDYYTNLDMLDDLITDYCFKQYSAIILISNFSSVKKFFNESVCYNFEQIFKRIEEKFPGNFIAKIYDNEITDTFETFTIECVDSVIK